MENKMIQEAKEFLGNEYFDSLNISYVKNGNKS